MILSTRVPTICTAFHKASSVTPSAFVQRSTAALSPTSTLAYESGSSAALVSDVIVCSRVGSRTQRNQLAQKNSASKAMPAMKPITVAMPVQR